MTDTKLLENLRTVVNSAVRDQFELLAITKSKLQNENNTYKKVEQVLWNYPKFEKVIRDKEEQILEIKEHGLKTKSKSILEYHETSGAIQGLNTTEDTIAQAVEDIQEQIIWLEKTLEKIQRALEFVKQDEYYQIIPNYYFDGVSRNQLADYYKVEVRTIARHKNRLVRMLALHLFPKETINNMMEG